MVLLCPLFPQARMAATSVWAAAPPLGDTFSVRVGIADHFGWAIAVTASAEHEVIDRRRLELIEADVTAAPIHYDGNRFDVAGVSGLVTEVRASAERASSAALDGLPDTVDSISLRAWPPDFPTDIAVQL